MLTPEEELELQKKLQSLKKSQESMEKSRPESEQKILTDPQAKLFLRYTHLGVEFIAVFGVIAWLGAKADSFLNSDPVGLLAGVFLGFGAAMYRIIRAANELGNQ